MLTEATCPMRPFLPGSLCGVFVSAAAFFPQPLGQCPVQWMRITVLTNDAALILDYSDQPKEASPPTALPSRLSEK